MRVGFVGLGAMGLPIARNLIRAGHSVTAYNRTAARAELLVADGASAAASPAEACADGIVLTMLADDQALESCAYGEHGILGALPAGGLHISLSTISVALSARLAADHQARGQSFVAAPVFGRPDFAEAAKLLVVAAGPAEAVERARPLLEAIGRKLYVLGDSPPMANALKLCGNFLLASMVESLSEAFALGERHGIAPATALEILNTLFQSPVYQTYGNLISQRKFDPAGFKMKLSLKDVRLVLAAADAVNVPMPVASLVHDQLLAGVGRGLGDLDWSALSEMARANAGLE